MQQKKDSTMINFIIPKKPLHSSCTGRWSPTAMFFCLLVVVKCFLMRSMLSFQAKIIVHWTDTTICWRVLLPSSPPEHDQTNFPGSVALKYSSSSPCQIIISHLNLYMWEKEGNKCQLGCFIFGNGMDSGLPSFLLPGFLTKWNWFKYALIGH